MVSVQVGALKAFLQEKGIDAIGRHYYKFIEAYIQPDDVRRIESGLVGDDFFGMLLFEEHKENIKKRIRRQTNDSVNIEMCLIGLSKFVDDVVDDIVAVNPSVLALTTTHMQYLSSLFIAKRVKEIHPNVQVVLGGLALYGDPAVETLNLFSFVDYIIYGEGETALWRLIQSISREISIETVPQLIYRTVTGIHTSEKIETIEDLNTLPYPDYSEYFDLSIKLGASNTPTIPRISLESVRGCKWGRCTFCIEGLPSRGGFRAKSSERVMNEIERCVKDFGVLDFVLTDPDVAFSGPAFQAARTLGYDLHFMVELSGLVKTEEFHKMIDAGVNVVQIGIESFSPTMLKKYNKGVKLGKYIELLKICKERNITLIYNNIYNAPFETQKDVDEAIANMRRLIYFTPPRTSVFRVSTGSQILANPAKFGISSICPSPEVEGYPLDIAEKVGVLISFNAGYGFKREEDCEIVDYTEYFGVLQRWKAIYEVGAGMFARYGAGYIRIEHRIGDSCFSIDITDPVEVEVYKYCRQLRQRQEIDKQFPLYAKDVIDRAISNLWDAKVLFVCDEHFLALASFANNIR